MLKLNDSIENIHSVGKTTSSRLKGLGINRVKDLLFHFPFRYEDLRNTTRIKDLVLGEKASIQGEVELMHNKRSPRKHIYISEALIGDGSEKIKAIWFNQPFIARTLRVGDQISLAGKIEGEENNLVIMSPVYEKLGAGPRIHTAGLVPNYPLTANITQKQIRFLINLALPLAKELDDWLPPEIISRQNLTVLPKAIAVIHFPKKTSNIEKARQRFGFEELFLLQLKSLIIKTELNKYQAPAIKFKEKETKNFVQKLPFKLTDDQKKTSWQILKDLGKTKPMARLLEGDVGSGKTMVAVIAMLNTALNNKQSILMVPTEILAYQHFVSISRLLKNQNIKIALFSRSEKRFWHKKQEEAMNKEKLSRLIAGGQADIVIGTHALIEENVVFKNLALAIIDEQHRFGVKQRKTLIEKSGDASTSPHLMTMTATPIPRSLALAIYGELDISIIKELPQGRKKIITSVVPESKRLESYRFIRQQIFEGRQIFVICPLIDESDKLGVKSVKNEFEKLNQEIFPDIEIGLLHGRLKAREKEKVMDDFKNNKTKILVSTSVVEVGVDIPNASIMIIEGAERFGLAQLHQFRGRVGRSEHQSYCFLFTENLSEQVRKRLEAMVKYHSGFDLAKIDLQMRGPGEVYGTMQKGFPQLKFASLFDYELIKKAKEEAEIIYKKSPKLNKYPLLKEKMSASGNDTHLE